jgi:hypothetical protein
MIRCLTCDQTFEENPDLPRVIHGRVETQTCPFCDSHNVVWCDESDARE